MQTHTWKARPLGRTRAVAGKHAKRAPHTNPPGKIARRILITALLLGSLAAGSAAISHNATATGSVSAHHQTAAKPDSPWMY
jgi:hypothetical protein